MTLPGTEQNSKDGLNGSRQGDAPLLWQLFWFNYNKAFASDTFPSLTRLALQLVISLRTCSLLHQRMLEL